MPSTWSQVLFHIVFSTKGRQEWITADLSPRLYAFMGGIVRDEGGTLLAIGGMPDHVHLLVRWTTDRGIADLVRHVKSRSSAWLHREYSRDYGWQIGGGVFSVSASACESVKQYIEHQAEHHAQRSFHDEFVTLLDRHGIEYDPKYL
jgi:putative transposase